jgi:hypothetical protein
MSDPETFPADRGPTLRGQLKKSIRALNKEETRKGADVDQVVADAVGATEYTETDVRETLKQMLLEGEVYPPTEGRVKVTPR